MRILEDRSLALAGLERTAIRHLQPPFQQRTCSDTVECLAGLTLLLRTCIGFYIFKVLFGYKLIVSILIARKRKRERLERSELYQQQWINVPHVFLI